MKSLARTGALEFDYNSACTTITARRQDAWPRFVEFVHDLVIVIPENGSGSIRSIAIFVGFVPSSLDWQRSVMCAGSPAS